MSVSSQEQLSQIANKKIARLKLAIALEEKREASKANSKADLWQQNQNLERGNEVRSYEGAKFKLR